MWNVTVFLSSSTVYVPKSDRLRRMIAAYSSGVPVRRLFEAIFGRSLATWICEKRPLGVKISRPLGVSPNGNDFLPSGALTSATTKSQVPTIWVFRLCAGALFASASERAASAIGSVFMMFLLCQGKFRSVRAGMQEGKSCAPVGGARGGHETVSPVCCRLRPPAQRSVSEAVRGCGRAPKTAQKAPLKIPKRIEPLVEAGLVDSVSRQLMSGKEAMIYVVRCGDEVRCAKVYKEADKRAFRQSVDYTEGRRVKNSRRARAMEKGSRYGRKAKEEAWQSAEVDALVRLAAAGVRVPQPYNFIDGVLLMELVTDAEGNAAPRLADLNFTPEQARELHLALIREVVRMLCA